MRECLTAWGASEACLCWGYVRLTAFDRYAVGRKQRLLVLGHKGATCVA
ncbi:MAG: hypothetical protein IKA20_02750 [Clostridia bacterium]|nr:hypothetical protein [Clostridia bacterium]